MAQGKATTKSNQVDYYYIETYADFTPCMNAVGSIGFSGTLTSTLDADRQLIWSLVLNSANQSGVMVSIGEVLSWDGMSLTVFPSADAFLALHTVP